MTEEPLDFSPSRLVIARDFAKKVLSANTIEEARRNYVNYVLKDVLGVPWDFKIE
jgi:hypothetical protein